MEVAFVFVFVGVIGWAIAAGRRQKARKQSVLESLAGYVRGTYDETGSVSGQLDGTVVTLGYVTRGSGSSAESWTEIDAEIPAKYPLTIYLRRHGWLDRGKIERGEMVDVKVGSPAFDDAFLVEAAPADVAKLLFDTRTQDFLLSCTNTLELTTERTGRPTIRLAQRAWIFELHAATHALDVVASLARRVREAYAAAEQATSATETGSPYRPVLDDRAARDAAEARYREVERLDAIRQQRASREKLLGVVILLVFVGVCLMAFLR